VLFLQGILLSCLAIASSPAFDQSEHTKPPHIIVFLVDDLGVMDTSVPFMLDASGQPQRYPLNDFYRTPHLERLAAQGVRLNNFYAMSVCSPTRTSILSGQNAARHRVTQWIRSESNNRGKFGPPLWNWGGLTNSRATLPGVLQTAGYRTIYIGKAHFGPIGQPTEFPDRLGYDINIAGCSWGQPGSYYGQDGYGHINGNRSRAVPHLEKYHGTDTFLTAALTREAQAQIDAGLADDQPFFLQFAPYAVHAPFQSNPSYAANYVDSGKSKDAQAYATLVESMDTALGELMEHLDRRGIAESTLILFLGDNGGDAPLGPTHEHHSSFPLRGKKGTHYEGGSRTPFIVAWAKPDPGNPWQQKLPIAAGEVNTQLATVMDLYPTVLNLVDAAPPIDHILDGHDLTHQLANRPNPDRSNQFLLHFPHDHRSSYFTSLRVDHWKLIYHYLPEQNPAKTRYELFDLAVDPYENHNLAEQQPAKVRELLETMIQQLEDQAALYPVDEHGQTLKPRLAD
jgi:arylsulfatase A-like enzyme